MALECGMAIEDDVGNKSAEQHSVVTNSIQNETDHRTSSVHLVSCQAGLSIHVWEHKARTLGPGDGIQ